MPSALKTHWDFCSKFGINDFIIKLFKLSFQEMKEEPEKYSGDLIPGSFEYAVNVIDDRLVVNNTYPDVFWNIASVEKKMSEQDDQISLSDCLLGERILHDKDRKHLHKFQQVHFFIKSDLIDSQS